MKNRLLLGAALLALGIPMSGCFNRSESQESATAPIRTPRPTFTPTPPQPVVLDVPAAAQPAAENAAPPAGDQPASVPSAPVEQPTAQSAEPATSAPQSAIAVVNNDMINIRRGPGLQYPVLKLGMRGDQFTIVGRSADDEWWQLCCVDELPGWIAQQYADTDGPVDAIAVAEPDAAVQELVVSPPTPEPIAAAPPADPPAAQADSPPATLVPSPALAFNLVTQERFPENNNLVRVFLYVGQGDKAVPGYSLRIVHDGVEMPVSAITADAAGMTWPIASPRQRFQNMKVEFPGVNSAGVWEIQLLDGGRAPAGPAATFTLAAADTDREFYVRYEKP